MIYTDQQFKSRYLIQNIQQYTNKSIQSIQQIQQIQSINNKQQLSQQYLNPNIDIDWTTKNGVSGVKNQGQCGSCWAFSATGVAQSFQLIFKQQLIDLSQQQLVDCANGKYNNYGCDGGWPTNALQYIKDHGLSYQSQYPYTAKTGICQKIGGNFHLSSINTVQGCVNITNTLSLKPLSVSVDATNWKLYSTGVFNNCIRNINHCVLLVGISNNVWKVKNSWGITWGEQGYIRLASGNTCGICSYGGYWIQ